LLASASNFFCHGAAFGISRANEQASSESLSYLLQSFTRESSLFVIAPEPGFEQFAVLRHEIQTEFGRAKTEKTLAEKSLCRRKQPMAFG
jgi:hypothetical protein